MRMSDFLVYGLIAIAVFELLRTLLRGKHNVECTGCPKRKQTEKSVQK